MVTCDEVSGFERDDFKPQRPIAPASTDEIAARQRKRAEARVRAGEIVDPDTRVVEDRRRFLERFGIKAS